VTFGSNLLSRFQSQRFTLFSSAYTLQGGTGKQVMLKIHNSVLDGLGATHFFTLRDPFLGGDPYFGNHWNRV